MNFPIEMDNKFEIQIRVRGKGEGVGDHEWSMFQTWSKAAVIRFFHIYMHKNECDAERLVNSYDDFEFDLAIKPEHVGGREDSLHGIDDALPGTS